MEIATPLPYSTLRDIPSSWTSGLSAAAVLKAVKCAENEGFGKSEGICNMYDFGEF